jgi:putative spermidine/putrescine transport system permease protein
MVLILFAVMRGIDRQYLRSARSLGAGPARAFFRVFLPLSMPGIEAGCILTVILAAGSYVIPAVLGGQGGTMYGVIIEVAIDQLGNWGLASATAVVLVVVVALALLAYRRLMAGNVTWLADPELLGNRHHGARSSWRQAALSPFRRASDRFASFLDWTGLSRHRAPLAIFSGACAVFLVVPQLIAIPISLSSTQAFVFPPPGLSLRWYQNFLTPAWLGPLGLSLIIATVTAIGATLLGGLAAFGVARGFRSRGAGILSLIFILPLLVPSIVAVVGVYIAFLYAHLLDTVQGFLLVYVAIAIPGAFIVMTASIRGLNPDFERAAASLGAKRWQVLYRIILPLLRPAVAVSLLFAFLAAFDEVVFAIFLSGVNITTLPMQMFEAIQYQADPTIGVVATLSLVVSIVVLVASAKLGRFSQTTTQEAL